MGEILFQSHNRRSDEFGLTEVDITEHRPDDTLLAYTATFCFFMILLILALDALVG